MVRTTYVLRAFILGWTKPWTANQPEESLLDSEDPFHAAIMRVTEGRVHEEFNREIARQFGEIVTRVKTFPTPSSGWIILDKSTKRLLHKDIKNENEVDLICKAKGYLR